MNPNEKSKTYLVEFASGRTIYVFQWSVKKVIDYCEFAYEKDAIKSIFEEVYVGQEEFEDA